MEPSSVEKGISLQETKGLLGVIPKTELLAKMEQLQTPIGIKISSSMHDRLQESFSPFVERAFLLFEKDGIISKMIESTQPNSPRSFSFKGSQLYEVSNIMTQEGYSYVGTYHHHLDSDRQTDYRRNPPTGHEAYILGPNYDPIQLSPDDRGAFKCAGADKYSMGSEKEQEMEKILSNTRYLLLGHFSEKNNFRMRAYTVLSHLSSEHPWNKYKEQLKENGLMLEHYRGFDDILNQPIEITETEDNDPEAVSILKKYEVKNRKYEGILLDSNSDKVVRVFTCDGIINQIEIWGDKNMIRYQVDSNGLLSSVTEYGDNTTKSEKIDIHRFTADEVMTAQKDFDVQVAPQARKLVSKK